MSYVDASDPSCAECGDSIALIIRPKQKDLGEFSVRRALPAPNRRMIGSFIFFDHMGPAEFAPGDGIQVRPHPHIGIATVTYLFAGEIMHRDDLGYEQPIQCGAVNLMTAGRGIVHSERAGDDLHETSQLHGIQSWMALPEDEQECAPSFRHYPADQLPEIERDGVSVRVIIGSAYGATSPVHAYSSTLYLECKMAASAELTLPDDYEELAVYVVSGEVLVDDQTFGDGVMLVAAAGKSMTLQATEEAHVMIIGGENLGKRYIEWNFVSSSRERIEKAKADWREQKFGKIDGDDEFIPLPGG